MDLVWRKAACLLFWNRGGLRGVDTLPVHVEDHGLTKIALQQDECIGSFAALFLATILQCFGLAPVGTHLFQTRHLQLVSERVLLSVFVGRQWRGIEHDANRIRAPVPNERLHATFLLHVTAELPRCGSREHFEQVEQIRLAASVWPDQHIEIARFPANIAQGPETFNL